MTGVHLLLFALAVSVSAPRMLVGADWAYRSPRLGIAAWYATLVAVGTAALGAVVSWLAPWRHADAPVCVTWRWCMHAAAGGYGAAGRALFFTVVGFVAAFTLRVVTVAVRVARAAAERRRRHMLTLNLAGRVAPDLGATVVEHPQPAAYVVAGHDRRVVVTTGALRHLAADELAAVLAHERAHAAGRHDLIVDGIRLLQHGLPKARLLVYARAELGRLVELLADDVATRAHTRISLARALVAMAGTEPAAVQDPPVAVLAATGGDAMARLQRLLTPPVPLPRQQRWALSAVLGLIAVAPAALLVAAQFFPVLGMCPTLTS